MPFFLVLLFVISCHKGEESSKKNVENISKIKTTKLLATTVGLPTPFKYQVKLNWNQQQPWLLYRENEKEGLKYLVTLSEDSKEYTDPHVVSGESYSYFLAELLGEETTFREKVSITIPKDIYINEHTDKFTTIKGPHRLFLGPQARILTLGRYFKIDVDEVFSENARIYTFEKPAIRSQNGRSGSTIVIRSRKAHGVLHIFGNGEEGGRGMDGADGTEGKKVENGTPAIIERGEVHADDLKRFIFNPKYIHCTATEETIAEVSRNWGKYNWRCIKNPSSGADGENGGNGGKGSPGLKGGDSAKIFVEIKESSQFQIYPEQKAGVGGEGGYGGRAGKGSKGGAAGLNFTQNICPDAQKGKDGRDGERGIDGEKGEHGEALYYCLKLGNITLGHCDKFIVSPDGEVW